MVTAHRCILEARAPSLLEIAEEVSIVNAKLNSVGKFYGDVYLCICPNLSNGT
jgi:hypothetical protein